MKMNKRIWQLYEEERDKLNPLPDSDSDFIALFKAWERYSEESD